MSKRHILYSILLMVSALVALIITRSFVRNEGDEGESVANPSVTMSHHLNGGGGMVAEGDSAGYSPPPINDVIHLDELLEEFGMTNDAAFLEKAQKLYPNDTKVVMLSALWADSVDSKWLDRLEALQPNNALPNVIRASFYADSSSHNEFESEMIKAMSKPDLLTGLKERQANRLDGVMRSGNLPNGVFDFKYVPGVGALHDGVYGFDSPFAMQEGRISNMLYFNNSRKFKVEDVDTSLTSLRLEWAKRLQSLPGLDVSYRMKGLGFEMMTLESISNKDMLYGSDGMTVGGRIEELQRNYASMDGKFIKFNELIVPNHSNALLRIQFFSRVAADGELAALDWLAQQ